MLSGDTLLIKQVRNTTPWEPQVIEPAQEKVPTG